MCNLLAALLIRLFRCAGQSRPIQSFVSFLHYVAHRSQGQCYLDSGMKAEFSFLSIFIKTHSTITKYTNKQYKSFNTLHIEVLAQNYSNLIFQERVKTDFCSQLWCQYKYFAIFAIQLYFNQKLQNAYTP